MPDAFAAAPSPGTKGLACERNVMKTLVPIKLTACGKCELALTEH